MRPEQHRHIYFWCRDLTKCEEERKKIVLDTKNKYVYCRKCDLSSIESIKEFVNQFQSQETKCDVLVNNAAVMKCRKMVTKEGIESQLGVNHMGHILLTHLLKPSLEKADTNGRVKFLMQMLHFINHNWQICYQFYTWRSSGDRKTSSSMRCILVSVPLILSVIWELTRAYPAI